MKKQKVIVIGSGVVGAATAFFLLEGGCEVTVIDQGSFGRGCSHGNCGYVCPSHVLPLAEEGAIGRAIRAVFQRNAPFSIKPRLDVKLWSWLWHFARNCNDTAMLTAGHAIQSLLESSMSEYQRLVTDGTLDCEWQERGLLYVYRSRAALDAYTETDELLRDVFDHPAVKYDAAEVVRAEPALRPDVAGGWFYPRDAHLRSDKLMSSWRRALEARGATIVEQCTLSGFKTVGHAARAALTSDGEMKADSFVVATGAWTPMLADVLRCPVPIQPGKGYSITMSRPARCPVVPMIFPETRVAVTPMQSSYRLGSTMEFAGYDTSINPKRLNLLRKGAEPYLIEPYTDAVTEEWFGWRPMTVDGLPLVGPSPAMDNVMIAAGNNMIGVATSPATGRLAAEMVMGKTPHIRPEPFSPTRFT